MAKIFIFPVKQEAKISKKKNAQENKIVSIKISFPKNEELKDSPKYKCSLPWNDLVVPILLSAICFGVIMGIVSFVLFGAEGYYYQLSSTGIGVITGILLPFGIIFFIWLTRKMYPFNTI